MIKYLRWNTANKRIKDLIANTNFDEVRINDQAGDYTFLIDMPSGEHIELWLRPSHIDIVWYCNGNERAAIDTDKHLIAKRFVFELYKAIVRRTSVNEIERAFYKIVDGIFPYSI